MDEDTHTPAPDRILKFDPETLNALLQVEAPISALEKTRGVAQEKGLFQKNEFHFTIIGRQTGEEIGLRLDKFSTEEKTSIVRNISTLLKEYSWSYILVDEYYLISKTYEEGEERHSIIQIIEVSELESVYQTINQILGTSFPVSFPHITLYTASTKTDNRLRGIGLYFKEQFSALCPEQL